MTQRAVQFSSEDIEKLKQAIAQGVQTVSYSDRSITYRSLDEMIRLLKLLTSDEKNKKAYYPSFSSRRLPR